MLPSALRHGQDITPSGPVFSSVTRQADALIVSFLYADGLQTSDGKAPSCFEIAEEDGLFHPATATIEGNTVRLTSPTIKHPQWLYGCAKVALWQCKRACFEPSFVVCYACERRNVFCVSKIRQIAQNSKISHQRFLRAFNS